MENLYNKLMKLFIIMYFSNDSFILLIWVDNVKLMNVFPALQSSLYLFIYFYYSGEKT